MTNKLKIAGCSLLFLLSLCGCTGNRTTHAGDFVATDLTQIREAGEITAVTLYSSISYFQYKMQPMGYEYDMIQDFAKSEGLKLNILVAENEARMIEMLENGEVDVIAYPMPVLKEMKDRVIYCGREELDTQVLIQQANKGDEILADVTQLIGKDIYVNAQTKYHERLKNLNEELGGGINIHLMPEDSITTEDLIAQVSKGEIPYTVSNEKIAKLNKTYFWNIDYSLKVSFLQRSAWVVRNTSPELAQAIDEWVSGKSGSHIYKASIKRYFELSKQPFTAELSEVKNGHISPYDDLFRKHAKNMEWDWQLLASIAYQESHFNPNAVSWAGAEGLMGIMPNTAKALGVTPHELKEPDTGIKTGVDCLRRFRQGFTKIEDPDERLKFTLGAYNAGIGHVFDAQRLAEKNGKDPQVWDNNVALYIRLKSDPEYYNDPVCKHGYLRGSVTYNYVHDVIERYNYYKDNTKGN